MIKDSGEEKVRQTDDRDSGEEVRQSGTVGKRGLDR